MRSAEPRSRQSLPTCPPAHLPTCPPAHLPTCPPAHLSTCRCVALSRGMGINGHEFHTRMASDAIAETYRQLDRQDTTAWTLELDLRSSVEKF